MLQPIPIPDVVSEDETSKTSEVDRGRSTDWEGGIVAGSSMEEPANGPTFNGEELPAVQRRTKTLGGVDK
jgi:hypothetical protein